MRGRDMLFPKDFREDMLLYLVDVIYVVDYLMYY